MKAWMRRLKIELISPITKSKLVFGEDGKDNLTISVQGSKYPALLKDKGTISIYNLDYATITKIILYKYYKVKIYAGYRDTGEILIFSGQISYISNKIHSAHDWQCYICFASDVVSQYSQNRMNLNLTSGINLYTAIENICYRSGITNPHIDPELKNTFINEVNNLYGTTSTILESATLTNQGKYTISSDNTLGTVIDVTTTKGKRIIKIKNDTIPIGGGNPRLSSAGLQITLLPTFNFQPGDILQIDNGILDVSISSADSVTTTYNTNYLDKNGMYMITELTYTFENRGNSFQYDIKARALNIISQFDTEA